MTSPGNCSPAGDTLIPEDFRAPDMKVAICLSHVGIEPRISPQKHCHGFIQMARLGYQGPSGSKRIHSSGPVRRWQPLCNSHDAYYHTVQGFAVGSAYMREAINQVKDQRSCHER